MLKVENACAMNLENAMRGARNPMESWARSDSAYGADGKYVLGTNDLDLALRLCAAVLVEGVRHVQGRHVRQLHVHHAQAPRPSHLRGRLQH